MSGGGKGILEKKAEKKRNEQFKNREDQDGPHWRLSSTVPATTSMVIKQEK